MYGAEDRDFGQYRGWTFAAALDKVIEVQRPTWRNGGKSEAQWRASLRDYAGGLMNKPVSEITTADVLAVLVPIWNTKRGHCQTNLI